jgi:hypothetical protein
MHAPGAAVVNSHAHAQVLGLVDWNPSGARILHTYKYGSAAGGLEGSRYTLPTLRWLGLRSCMLLTTPSGAAGGGPEAGADLSAMPGMQQLTQRDRSLARGLMASLGSLGEEGWCAEVRRFCDLGEGVCSTYL